MATPSVNHPDDVMQPAESEPAVAPERAGIKTFLIADVRGYTSFTQDHGDEAAAGLATKFAEFARESVSGRGGSVIELRGDEALAVFDSAREAIRAAMELQVRFVEETIRDPTLPLGVGIGIDAGEAVPVPGGYRGGALNLAARLCGMAGPGEVLATREVTHLARKIEGIKYVDRGYVRFKGLTDEVHVMRVRPEDADLADESAFRRALGPVAGGLLRRSRLEERLDEAFAKRLTLVIAGAGYGKSTLVAAWAADIDCAWITTTSRAAALSSFFSDLVGALAPRVPGFPPELSSVAVAAAPSESDERGYADTLAGLLADALAKRLEHDLVLVVDDAHLLPAEGPSARLVETLCRQAPEPLHLVIVSRSEPPFAIERLRGQGQVLELDAADLAFDAREVGALVRRVLGDDEASATGLLEVTSGWPAAVRMAIERLRTTALDDRPAELSAMRRPGGPLFSYLAEEVFAREPESVRDLIRLVAPLERFSPDLCNALGVLRPAEALRSLAERGLLVRTKRDSDDWLELHALVRDFARSTWPLSEAQSHTVHVRAAAWLEDHGHLRDALSEAARAQDQEWLASFLARRGDTLLTIDVKTLIAACESLTDELRDESIDVVLGEALHITGDVPAGLELLERIAGDRAEIPPRLATWIGVGYASGLGTPADAIPFYRRGRIGEGSTADESLLLSWWARAHCRLGEAAEARSLAARSLEIARVSGDPVALAHAHIALGFTALVEGDDLGAEAESLKAIDVGERCGDARANAGARNNLAELYVSQGRYDEAIALLEPAIRLGELHYPFGNIAPLGRLSRASALVQVGRFEEAITDAEQALSELRHWRDSTVSALPLTVLGDIHRIRGQLVVARRSYEEALPLAERGGESQTLVPVLTGLACVLAFTEPDRGGLLAERAVAVAGAPELATAKVAAAWVALATGDREHAAALTAEALETTSGRAVVAEALELEAAASRDPARRKTCLQEALSVWRKLGSPLATGCCELALARFEGDENGAARAEQKLRGLGINLEGAAAAAGLLACIPQVEQSPVAIRTLGGFQLLRAGTLVPLAEWQSRKARDLLKILVSRQGRPIPRESLMDALWPGEEPAKLSNRFSVALSTLRSVLDPGRDSPPEHYLRADLTAVSLANVSVDVESFLAEAEAGLSGDSERLEYAEALYAGDFLDEDRYEDWAVPLREEARATYIRVARALAEKSSETGEQDQSARYLRRILERDAFDERAHLALVSTLSAAGQHGEARRAYRAYTARMEEIDVEAMAYPAPLPA